MQYLYYILGILGFIFIIGAIIFRLGVKNETRRRIEEMEYEEKLEVISESNIDQIDQLSPFEFEQWISDILTILGYESTPTKKTGDYGIDVIAQNDEETIGIQVKKYNRPVGISAVQEVIAGMKYYGCNKGYVMTSAKSFTKAAKNLAEANEVFLYTRFDLAELLYNIKKAKESKQ